MRCGGRGPPQEKALLPLFRKKTILLDETLSVRFQRSLPLWFLQQGLRIQVHKQEASGNKGNSGAGSPTGVCQSMGRRGQATSLPSPCGRARGRGAGSCQQALLSFVREAKSPCCCVSLLNS